MYIYEKFIKMYWLTKYLTEIILGILSVGLFVLCSHPKENGNVKIDFDQLNKKDNLFSDEVFAKVAYVPLESDSACFISSNAELRLIGSKFYFLDPVEQQVFVLEEDGKFVNKIGRAGQGARKIHFGYRFLGGY